MGVRSVGLLHSLLSQRSLYSTSRWSRPFVHIYQEPHRSRAFSTTRFAMVALQRSALFEAIEHHDRESTAVVHSLSGRSFEYGSLLQDVANAKKKLLEQTGKDEKSIVGERVAFLIENSYDYVGALP